MLILMKSALAVLHRAGQSGSERVMKQPLFGEGRAALAAVQWRRLLLGSASVGPM